MSMNFEIAGDSRTSPRLPVLKEGRNSLVSPTQTVNQPTARERASEWALDVRMRINECIQENIEIREEDVTKLKLQLVAVFITTLQQDSRSSWMYLHEVLGLVEPFKDYLDLFNKKAELFHYLERIVCHVEAHNNRLFDIQILEALAEVFPDEISKLSHLGAHPARSYTSAAVPTLFIHPPSPKKTTVVPYMLLPDGTNPYSTYIPDEEPQYAYVKPLTFGDLRKSIAYVASEVAGRECIWNQSCGTITQALKTDIPETESQPKPMPSPTSSQASLTSVSSLSSLSGKKKTPRTPRVEEAFVPKMTGREAVEYFAKCHHTGQIKSLYFNVVPNRHYHPYDLTSVSQNKANAEHYVFSTFGVLHVYPDQQAESMTLAEWQREAVLWTAASSIPFFKKFLIRKMFCRWRYNKLHLDFLRRRLAVSTSLLQAVPAFGTALLQVTRLLKELVSVQFLPFELDKTYTLGEFENYVNYKNIQAEKVLERFFRYCKLVVDVTADESFKKMRLCEEQVKKKSLFTKDSLHVQKMKKAQREENLRRARGETGRLGNFVKLVDQLIIEHMFSITKAQIIAFINEVLKVGIDTQREGYFKASLVFTKQDVLGISPTKEKFLRALTNTLKAIPSVLCDNAIPIDGSLADHEMIPEETESSVPAKSEAGKSGDLKTVSDRRKSTAATMSSIKQGSHSHITAMSQTGETTGDQESQIGTTKSTIGDDTTQIPELLKQATLSKSDDEMGVATPDLVVPDENAVLQVAGEGFMGQYEPLSKASLEEKLERDAEFKKALKLQMDLMSEALEEVLQYCDYNKWLNEIQQFCRKWTERSVREYRGVAAFTIEQKLTELRQWSEKVRNFDRNFITENGLFYIDCSAIHDVLLPRLNDIYVELVTFIADEGKNLAKNFCDEMKMIFENMKDKRPTVNAFALFAKNFSLYKKNTAQYQQRVEYIKSLYEVIRMSFRQLTQEEEKYEENVWAAWEAFLLQMQDASEFVNTQTPLMTQLLEDTYQKKNSTSGFPETRAEPGGSKDENLFMRLERAAVELSEMATSGKFLDPTQKPTQILIETRKIREKFYEIQEQLQQASKWRDAICGEPYDLKFLNNMTVKMDVRQELWKYVEISTHAIKDWKQMLFKKMNIKKALEKLVEWQAAASQLKPYLPSGDQVLTTWFQSLQDFKKDLPLLHKLANDALKQRHWKAIFLGMNEAYDPKKCFTVADLLTYDLQEHAQLIHSIYLGSLAEYDLEMKIGQICKFWEERPFKLAKHIPDSVFTKKEPLKKPTSPTRRRTKLEKYRQERAAAAAAGSTKGLNLSDDDLFILIEVEELKYQIEDSRVSVKAMMQSPHLGDKRQEVEYWNSALQQVEEITDLWFLCQKKWLYLLKIFERPELYKRFSKLSQKFETMHNKFKDWMRVACNDSKVLTVVNRKRGEKGYRLLQGDNLRALILSLIQMQDEIMRHLDNLLETTRMEFPRLYFLSNEDLVELLAVSRNPQALLPVARKCFPGVYSLIFALPADIGSLNTHLDFELNADKLEVVAVRGQYGEEMSLFARLEAYSRATKWLRAFESIMKNTVALVLQGCVQARMEEGSRQPVHLLEELAKYSQYKNVQKEEITSEIKHQFRHWLLRFPIQCVLVAEGIMWEGNVSKCVDEEERKSDELKLLRINICSKIDQYIDLLQESFANGTIPAEMRDRLHVLLCSLIEQSIYHRDVTDSILSAEDVRDCCFEWLRVVKYHMDVRNVLRAKTESVEIAMQPHTHASRRQWKARRTSLPTKSQTDQSLDEPPKLNRTKTTVSTDYQFGLCHIQQMENVFSYDYEYLGPTKHLVLTPLTERAFLSLTQALRNFQCGTLIGPPGTGKSETVKEMARMFGQNLFTINCNEDVTLSMMTQYMMGMVQSSSWALFDDTDRLGKGLMSVAAQHLDYLHTAFRALDISSENQYKIRGQPRFDKKMGIGDKVIRRNSLTTLHPLPTVPHLERQKTVPHGFNEEGLVTYFEDTWIAEKDQRRHSIEREVEIKESDLYKSNRPPPLFYEHIKSRSRRSPPDYSHLLPETIYMHRILGNLMFNGKLIQANAKYGCFLTLNTTNKTCIQIPKTFKLLMRPCAMIVPDLQMIMDMILCCHGCKNHKDWAKKLYYFFKLMKMQMPRKKSYEVTVKDVKKMLFIAVAKMKDEHFLEELRGDDKDSGVIPSDLAQTESDLRSLEEHCIIYGLQEVLLPIMDEDDDYSLLLGIMRDVFPLSSRPGQHGYHGFKPKLVNAIKDQLRENNLKESPEFMSKILQLHSAINLKQGVIMVGTSGAGKTTCCQTLAQTINRLNYLLFAPDHSKDELTTDKDFVFHTKHKFKDLVSEDMDDDVFMMKMETPKDLARRKPQKMGNALSKVNESINELETTPPHRTSNPSEYPKVDIIRLNPTALSPQEFLGTFQNGVWQGGLFPKILNDACYLSEAVKTYLQHFKDKKISSKMQVEPPSALLQWIVLDGVMHPCWTESLNTLLDEERKLSLANGGHICLQDSTALLFETCELRDVSPATLSRCTVVHFGGETVHWHLLYDCWTRTAKSKWVITTACLRVMDDLVKDVFGPTIKFLKNDCCTALLTDVGQSVALANEVAPGIQEVASFLKILSAFLDRGFLRDDFEKQFKNIEAEAVATAEGAPESTRVAPSRQANSRMTSSSQIEQTIPYYMEVMKGIFAFAFIWGFGGHIHERYSEKFSKFARDVLYRATHPIRIPPVGTVFDYCLEESSGTFIKWSEKQQERLKVLAGGYAITPDIERYTYLIDLMLGAHQPVLISGFPGVGKTAMIQTMVLHKQPSTCISMSPGMTSSMFQNKVLSHVLELKQKALSIVSAPGTSVPSGPKVKQHHLFFIDDLNTAPGSEGYQTPLELFRQILTQGGTYEKQRQQFQDMEEAIFLAATALPTVAGSGLGQSCHIMSSRLTRLFLNITMFTPSPKGLLTMFGRNLQNWLEEFPTYSVEHHFEFARAMTLGLLELYHRIKEKFRPTPAHAHYIFSLHDVGRVIQGVMLMSPRSKTRKMMRRRKGDKDEKSKASGCKTYVDSSSRTISVGSNADPMDGDPSAPMMKNIAQLWCHECCRTFADRLINEEDHLWFGRILEEIAVKYLCLPREDPRAEMAAISEETFSQAGRGTPHSLTPPPSTPESDLDLEEQELMRSEEVLGDSMRDPQSRAQSPSHGKSPLLEQSTGSSRLVSTEHSTAAASTVLDVLKETGEMAETLSGHVLHTQDGTRTTSEMESEATGETEDSSDGETSATETDTVGTPADLASIDNIHRRESRVSSGVTEASRSTPVSVEPVIDDNTRDGQKDEGTLAPESGLSSGESPTGLVGKSSGIQNFKCQSSRVIKRAVTFKSGLYTDREHEAYFGSLMTVEELKGNSESLTRFIFSKFFMTTFTETQNLQVEKGYVESSEEVLTDALQSCLTTYNNSTSQRLELVFFSEAIKHAARLSRVLAIQGGHALLLGMSYSTGRATLVRLAAYIAHCKKPPGYCCRHSCRGLYEPKPQINAKKNLHVVHEHMKRCCYHAGILGKPIVLLIHEDLGTECLQDVCCLMAQGTSPGLYTDYEMQTITSMMMPGGVQTKRIDKIEQAFERYVKKVRQNLHVVVCLNYRGNSFSTDFHSLHTKVCCYPGLVRNSSSVDLYMPWSHDAYIRMAEVWLQDERSKIHIPWHPSRQQEQITLTSKAMAYMHLSAKQMVERQFCHQKEPLRFYSPLTFMEFVHLMRVVTAIIVKKETQRIKQHEKALAKVDEALDSIAAYKREVSDLVPQQKMAVQEIKDLVEQVEEQKQQYIEALDRCKAQEQLIVQLQGPLEELRKEAQTEFDKNGMEVVKFVNPNYQAALEALGALDSKAFDEVRTFPAPPEAVKFVVNALCLLFQKPQNWESGKLLMIRKNFVQDLVFYDKDNMPDEIFNELKKFVLHPNFNPTLIRTVSMAAESICVWIHAVYKYADIHRNMQPRLKNLLEHEEKFTLSQAKLGHLRVEASCIKSALERKITIHKSAVRRAKTIERHIQTIEKRIARAMNLMEHMSMQHYLWKSELKKARRHVISAPGDSLVMAACVCYHGPLDDKSREELIQDWLERCRQGNFTLSKQIGQDVYPLGINLADLFEGHREKDSDSEMSGSHAGETTSENGMTGIPALPEIRVFKYPPALYDTSKYYKSELEKEGSMEYDAYNVDVDDSDDDEEHSSLMNRNGFSLQDILSDFDELSKWRMDSLPTDLHSIQNALLMRVSCFNRKHCWPLLIDPDNQAELWVRALQTSKNLFAEKDVREGTPDEPDGIPLESSSDKDSQILPPSRGTGFTMSDMTPVYTMMDDTTEPTLTSATMTSYTGMSMDRQSRQTWNSEELRPVTSVTNSWETYSLRVEPTITHPPHNLWIVEADDPQLDNRLINAIVHGVTVLVTHLERKPLDPLFRGLLLKQFFVDKDGNRIIKAGSYEFHYHPNFCLYLSTSIPLFLKGDGLHNFPLHRMCMINMAMSDEAIINRLLLETMKVERKEFEGQKRSNENDIILHRQRLARENEIIREKTLNLDVPLLEDLTMLQALITSKNEVEKNRMILEETRYMGDHLEEKFAHYMPMITDAAVLYNMAKRMGVLHPYYYLPFYKFVDMYSTVIKSRDRGKGSSGAPNARAQELADATLTTIFQYLRMMMFEKHYTLLQFLFTMERMRMTRKASNKELSIFVNGFDKKGLDEMSLQEHKPAFLTDKAWIDCLVLEQLHHPFHGLRRSLLQNGTLWEEHFKHPIALMNSVPGSSLQELSVFQKCILWKMCCIHRVDEIMNALILHDLGNMHTGPDHYNIREVYSYTDKTTPIIFLMPTSADKHHPVPDGTSGISYVNPSHEVKRLAKELGMEGKVRVMNFGVGGLMLEVKQALEDCLQSGYWLLLQNYHLAEEPAQSYFDLLKAIVYSKWVGGKDRQDSDISDDTASLVTRSRPSHHSQGEVVINPTFRLWITTETDVGRLVPGVLVQHGLKVTVEYTQNFKSTLQKAYCSVAYLFNMSRFTEDEEKGEYACVMPLALLHAILLQQSYYGSNAFVSHYHWTLTDLAVAVEAFRKVMRSSGSVKGVKEVVCQVYADHCIDSLDAGVVRQLVSTLAQYSVITNEKQEGSCDVVMLLQQLLNIGEPFSLSRSIESLVETSAKTFGLPSTADHDLMAMTSRVLSKDMIQVIGSPELFLRIAATPSPSFLSGENVVPQILSALQLCLSLPETSRNQVIPLDLFFHHEIEGFRNLLQTIQSDLNLLQRKSRGEVLPGSNLDDVASALNRGSVPSSWMSHTFPSGSNLMVWVNSLPVRTRMLLSYIGSSRPSVYNLSVFLRPDKFLEAVKQTYARSHFQELDSIDLQIQVMPHGLEPSVPPSDGVFLSGLCLHNALWDTTGSVLMCGTDDSVERQTMPVIWSKPVDVSAAQRSEIRNELYLCPVFCSVDHKQHGDPSVVSYFPLSTLLTAGLWQQKRTFLSSSLFE